MSKTVNVHEAKTNLSRLIARALAGEDVVIARAGKPAVRLVPVAPRSRASTFGIARGKIDTPPEFFDPLPEEELRAFEGS